MKLRPPSWGLVVRALWWRRGLTAAVLLVAVVTTTAAALGPLFARAAGESILQDHLTQAGSAAGVHMHAQIQMTSAGYSSTAAAALKPGSIRGYDQQIPGLFTPFGAGALANGSQTNVTTALVWRDGACQHLVIISGRCPDAPNEGIASQRTVDAPLYDWKIGGTVAVTPSPPPSFPSPPAPPPIRIVGVYRPINTADPFWFAQPYFGASPGTTNTADTVDAVFVAQSEFLSLSPETIVEADFDYPLTPSAVRLQSATAEQVAVSSLLAKHTDADPITANSSLAAVLASAARERHLAEVGTLLVTLQLTLLAWLVLFQIVSDAIEARGNEIAMAKLRGLSPGATVRFGLGEPVVLLAAAVPIGLLAAWAVTRLFAATVLVSGVPVVLPISAVLTALVAFAGGLGAAGLAGYRTLTRSVLDQWRRVNRTPGGGRLTLAADVLVTAAAIGGLILLHRTSHGGNASDNSSNRSVALLAPGLLVAAVGLLGVRLLPLLCRWLARLTRASRRVAIFLAARQVARRPVGLRLAALLAVAVGLATFAVAGETVASTNRTVRARAELGAPRVATIEFDSGVDPVTATARADPSGSWAMAAATWLPDGGDSVVGTVLGLDSRRLATVGFAAAGGPTAAEIARTVGAAAVPAITITAPELRVQVSGADLTGDHRPVLEVNLRTPHESFYNVDAGPIADGTHTYTLPVTCSEGCTLLGITWRRPITAQDAESGTLTLNGIDIGNGTAWTPLDLGFSKAGSWRPAVPEGQATDHVAIGPRGIEDQFTNEQGGFGGIVYAYAPSPMPAVATSKAIDGRPAHPQVVDSTNTTAYFQIMQYVPVLPAVLDDGVIMDVRDLLNELPGFAAEAQWQVWLGPKAPADALARLDAAGLHVESVRSEQTRVHQLSRQGPALALLLLLVCAVAGTVLAVGGTAISISASSRRRSYEIAALRAIGVSRRALLRASITEQLLLLGAAAVLGIPTGVLAARLAMPVIPEFADPTPIALQYTPTWLPTLLFAGAFVALLTMTALIAARALMRIAVPSRLREAEG